MEIWRDIKGYEGWYQVSNKGRVKRLKKIHFNHGKKNVIHREHILSPQSDRKGYQTVIISNGINRKHVKIHRLVAEAFLENPYKKNHVDHINRIVSDNRMENLRWCSNRENQYNASRNLILTCFEESMPLGIWAEKVGIKATTIRARIERGWSTEDALTIKPLKTGVKLYQGGMKNGREEKHDTV